MHETSAAFQVTNAVSELCEDGRGKPDGRVQAAFPSSIESTCPNRQSDANERPRLRESLFDEAGKVPAEAFVMIREAFVRRGGRPSGSTGTIVARSAESPMSSLEEAP